MIEAPPNTQFTHSENELLTYLFQRPRTGSINWNSFVTEWEYYGKRRKLEHQSAVIYKRSKGQLGDRLKTMGLR